MLCRWDGLERSQMLIRSYGLEISQILIRWDGLERSQRFQMLCRWDGLERSQMLIRLIGSCHVMSFCKMVLKGVNWMLHVIRSISPRYFWSHFCVFYAKYQADRQTNAVDEYKSFTFGKKWGFFGSKTRIYGWKGHEIRKLYLQIQYFYNLRAMDPAKIPYTFSKIASLKN